MLCRSVSLFLSTPAILNSDFNRHLMPRVKSGRPGAPDTTELPGKPGEQ
jgi:hypothetical protein